MAGATTSVDTMLADAVSKLDALTKRMDALETGEGSKNPIKGDDDDDKKDDATAKADATAPKKKILDDDDDDKKDDAAKKSDAAKKDDDGELEIKHGKKSDAAKKSDDDDDDKKKDDAEEDPEKKDDAFPPKKKADAKKADAKKADDDDDDDKKDDAAKADSVADLRQQIADQSAVIKRLESLMTPRSDDEHAAFADAQAKADAVFNGFGQRAPRPLEGESLLSYRKRLATKLKTHSPVWKGVKFSQLPEEAFNIAEGQVYSDATAAASSPADLEAGELRPVTKIDPVTGVRTIVFYGRESFVKAMGRPGRRVASFRTLASQ